MDNQRIFLFAILAVLILMLWSAWESEQRPPGAPVAVVKQEVPSTPTTAAAPSAPAKTGAPSPGAAQIATGTRIQVTTDLLNAGIDTQGGDLRVVELRKHSVSLDQREPTRLLDDRGPRIFIAQSGLLGPEGKVPRPKSRYSAEAGRYELAPGQAA